MTDIFPYSVTVTNPDLFEKIDQGDRETCVVCTCVNLIQSQLFAKGDLSLEVPQGEGQKLVEDKIRELVTSTEKNIKQLKMQGKTRQVPQLENFLSQLKQELESVIHSEKNLLEDTLTVLLNGALVPREAAPTGTVQPDGKPNYATLEDWRSLSLGDKYAVKVLVPRNLKNVEDFKKYLYGITDQRGLVSPAPIAVTLEVYQKTGKQTCNGYTRLTEPTDKEETHVLHAILLYGWQNEGPQDGYFLAWNSYPDDNNGSWIWHIPYSYITKGHIKEACTLLPNRQFEFDYEEHQKEAQNNFKAEQDRNLDAYWEKANIPRDKRPKIIDLSDLFQKPRDTPEVQISVRLFTISPYRIVNVFLTPRRGSIINTDILTTLKNTIDRWIKANFARTAIYYDYLYVIACLDEDAASLSPLPSSIDLLWKYNCDSKLLWSYECNSRLGKDQTDFLVQNFKPQNSITLQVN